MKHLKRALATLLSAALLVSALAACGGTGDKDGDGGQETDRPSAVEALTGLQPGDILFTVDGVDVTAGDYCYWLIYSIEMASANLYGGSDVIWTDEQNGVPMAEYLKNDAQEVCKSFAIIQAKAIEQGVALDAEDEAELEAIMDAYVRDMGQYEWDNALTNGTVSEDMGEEKMAAWIEEAGTKALEQRCYELGTTVDGLKNMERITLLYDRLQNALFGPGGPMEADDQEVAGYLAQVGLYKAKHILISIKDEEGNLMDEAGKAEARKRAEDILAQIKESEDPLAEFNVMMATYSEDPGLMTYPEGYLFSDGQMVPEFQAGVEALAENEISDIVESEHGYHIILRLSPVDDDTRAAYITHSYEELANQWLADAQVEETDAFVALDVQAFSANLDAIQAESETEQ